MLNPKQVMVTHVLGIPNADAQGPEESSTC